MKMPAFDYAAPATIEEAIGLLATRPGARLLSGGQSLLPLLAFRLASPTLLVDLQKIEGLDHITPTPQGLRLGARVCWAQIERDPRLADLHPLLKAMIEHVAHYQVRNRGTVGGSLAHADPAAEMPGLAVVCDCDIVVQGRHGTRSIAAGEFFTAALETVLAEDDIIIEVRFPPWPAERCWAFQEFSRRRGDFAIVGVAAFFDRDAQGRMVDPHVGVIGAGPTPRRLTDVERLLAGQPPGEELFAQARRAAEATVTPDSDIHAGADYRTSLAGTLTQRVLRAAASMQRTHT